MTALEADYLVDGDLVTMRLSGSLDIVAFPHVVALATRASGQAGVRSLAVNMADVDFMDAMGSAALVKTRHMCTDARIDMCLVSISPQVRRVLALAGLTEWFGV